MIDITKVKIWKVLAASNHFWVTTLILYMQNRGLSISQSLSLISIYSILCVVFEYPTGVIGDHFSHRTSVLLGTVLSVLMYFLVTIDGGYFYYLIVGAIMPAIAFTLISGSDTALLHAVSKDFKKDLAAITPIALILSAVNISLGGVLASIDIRLPYLVSSAYALIAVPFLFGLKDYKHVKDDANIFEAAKNGIKDVFDNHRLRDLMVISSVFGAFFLSIKWFYNPLFEALKIPVGYWGLIASIGFLLIAVGAAIFRKFDGLNLAKTSLLCLLAIILIGLTNYWFLPLLGIWLVHIVRGYQDTQMGVAMNDEITSSRRASILSFGSLTTRLSSAIYIAGIGYLLPISSFFVVSTLTVIIIALLIFIPMKNYLSKAAK